ncbi:unnamed protein product [Echinostoma caproni]|uniref:Reverse transcriptase domain-containing protein n=1 Tax=Echinostoma caproni TaxID=27848 RepID=A0A183B5A8_9TREM|nr:unnamed protein product [Echinostoma caproni]
MERAATVGNFRKLFHLIRVTGRKALGVSETICEADGSPIHNQQRRLERWAEHFKAQFSWSPAPASHTAIPAHVPWFVTTDSSSEKEIRKEIQAWSRHKAPGSDGLPLLYLKMVE